MSTPRWIALEGAANVRDLGGVPGIAPGVVIRSDNLQSLTPGDVDELVERRRVRSVVDLRTAYELRSEGPGPLAGDPRVEIRHRSLHPEEGTATDIDVDVLPWQEDGWGQRGPDPDETPAVRAYLGYLRDRPDSIVAALDDIATTDGATVVHCAAGKDRTGMVCAFALAVAGAPAAAIVADYAATAERLDGIIARLRASPTYAPDLEATTPDQHRPRPRTMERLLELLDERHGGPAGWLREHGFGAAEQQALRTRLTA